MQRLLRLAFCASLLGVLLGGSGGEDGYGIAAAPPTPIPSVTQADAVTGDNPPVSFTACGVTCTKCFLPDPNGNVDKYTDDIYERPTAWGLGGSAANVYFPALDIVSAQSRADPTYYYFRIILFGEDPQGSLPYRYAFAINFDGDARPDAYILSEDPKAKVGTTFGSLGVFLWHDANNNLGDGQITEPDGPAQTLGGYEVLVFDQGINSGAGGSDAVQARIALVAGIPKSVEFRVERAILDALNGAPITKRPLPFCTYTSKAGQTTASNTQLLHDEYSRRSGGSPYPWLAVAPVPAVAKCPTTNAADDALSTQQRMALDSGTSTNTGICNPCYPSGGNIFEYDSSCSIVKTPKPKKTPKP